MGVWRDGENGLPVDDAGEIRYSRDADGTFDGLRSLSMRLAESPAVQRCYTRMWFTWASGLDGDAGLGCTAETLADAYAAGRLPLSEVPLALVRSPHFTRRAGDPGLGATPALAVDH